MKYYLIRPEETRSSIYADINYGKFRLRTSVNNVISSINWDEESERVKPKEKYYSKINERLKFIKGSVDSLLSNIKLTKMPMTIDEFKLNIEHIISPDKVPEVQQVNIAEPIKLSVLLKNWIKDREFSGKYRPSTIKKYKGCETHFTDFIIYSKRDLYPEDMNESFYKDFTKYLLTKKNLVDNSVGVNVKILKTFLNNLQDDGINVNVKFKKFKAYKDPRPPTIGLTEDDLKKIDEVDLKENQSMIRTRDLFYVQLHTIQRVSDLFQLSREHFDFDSKLITITQKKTNTRVIIGLTNKVEEIFKKYDFKLPKISEQKYNDNLKKLCELAGITDDIEIARTQGNGRKVKVNPKCKFVSSHVIRRTAITHLLRKGVLEDYVKKISGIKSIIVFQQYKKFAEVESSIAIKAFWDQEDYTEIQESESK